MDTNKIREKVAAVRRADDEWDAIPGGYDESEAILKYSTAVNELLAELDAAPKVLTTEPVAWMTEDGRLASVTGKENMPSAADKVFCIPLYLAPAAGLTVDEVIKCVDDEAWTARDRIEDDPMSGITDHITKMVSSIHARLIAAIQAKS